MIGPRRGADQAILKGWSLTQDKGGISLQIRFLHVFQQLDRDSQIRIFMKALGRTLEENLIIPDVRKLGRKWENVMGKLRYISEMCSS